MSADGDSAGGGEFALARRGKIRKIKPRRFLGLMRTIFNVCRRFFVRTGFRDRAVMDMTCKVLRRDHVSRIPGRMFRWR